MAKGEVGYDPLVRNTLGRNNANNDFNSALIAANEDGSILERLQWIQIALGGAAGQLRVAQSTSGTVEENAIQQFSITIFDIDSGAVPAADIDITAISAVMYRSRAGGAFSAVGITQPVFTKGDGRVYDAYQFLAAEWTVGDMYQLRVVNITATISGDTAHIPAFVWSDIVVETEDVTTSVQRTEYGDAIWFDAGNGIAGTVYPVGTPQTPCDVIANVITMCAARNLRNIRIHGALVLGAIMEHYNFIGYCHENITDSLDLNGQDVDGSVVDCLLVTGAQGGTGLLTLIDSIVYTLVLFAGRMDKCSFYGSTCSFRDTSFIDLVDCDSIHGDTTITVQAPTRASIKNWTGNLKLTAQDGGLTYIRGFKGTLEIDVMTGGTLNVYAGNADITINVNCTGGIINVYGDALITGAGGGVTINDHTMNSVPTADVVTNLQMRDVIGNKTDTALAAPTAVDSMMRYVKGILNAVAAAALNFQEQDDVPVNMTAINASETNVFHMHAVDTRYLIRNLRLKCVDPGANTVTVRLHELINDVLIVVDSFEITTVNFATYHSLMGMFGLPHLDGDELKVTVQADAGGPYDVTGQYSYGIAA